MSHSVYIYYLFLLSLSSLNAQDAITSIEDLSIKRDSKPPLGYQQLYNIKNPYGELLTIYSKAELDTNDIFSSLQAGSFSKLIKPIDSLADLTTALTSANIVVIVCHLINSDSSRAMAPIYLKAASDNLPSIPFYSAYATCGISLDLKCKVVPTLKIFKAGILVQEIEGETSLANILNQLNAV